MAVMWETGVTLSDAERAMAKSYARRVVKSIMERTTDPKDRTILLHHAQSLGFAIYGAASLYSSRQDNQHDSRH